MTWAPRMDVYEKDNTLIVKADLPGLKNEDVQVELDDGGLVIRGASAAESEIKEENYYRMERSLGTFYRRLPLPFAVEPDQIQATMRDGLLEVRIPRPAEQKPKPSAYGSRSNSGGESWRYRHDSPLCGARVSCFLRYVGGAMWVQCSEGHCLLPRRVWSVALIRSGPISSSGDWHRQRLIQRKVNILGTVL